MSRISSNKKVAVSRRDYILIHKVIFKTIKSLLIAYLVVCLSMLEGDKIIAIFNMHFKRPFFPAQSMIALTSMRECS